MKITSTINTDSTQQQGENKPAAKSQVPQSQGQGLFSKKRLLISALLILLIVTAAIIVTFIVNRKTKVAIKPHTPVLTVTIQPALIKPLERLLAVHGSISAWDPVSVGATTSGLEVKNILVDEGALVKKNQVLAVLDSAQLQAQLDSEKARLAASVANVTKSIQPNRMEDINGFAAALAQAEASIGAEQAALVQAEANLANAKLNLKRYQYLRAEGAVSAQEAESRETTALVGEAAVQSAEKRVRAAEFAMKQAKERFSMAKVGGRSEDVQIAKANVAEIQGNIKRLMTQIDQTCIKAPIDGLITKRDVHLGDISVSGKTMFSMARDNRLELRAQVPESDLRFVHPGQVVSVDSSYLDANRVQGKVREISPLVDSDTRLAMVRIDIPAESGLKQGMYAEGHINVGSYSALTVPSQAVISRDEKNTVFVLHKDQVESREVTVGNRDSNSVQLSGGLSDNELVVVNGAGFLKDGDYVAVAR